MRSIVVIQSVKKIIEKRRKKEVRHEIVGLESLHEKAQDSRRPVNVGDVFRGCSRMKIQIYERGGDIVVIPASFLHR